MRHFPKYILLAGVLILLLVMAAGVASCEDMFSGHDADSEAWCDGTLVEGNMGVGVTLQPAKRLLSEEQTISVSMFFAGDTDMPSKVTGMDIYIGKNLYATYGRGEHTCAIPYEAWGKFPQPGDIKMPVYIVVHTTDGNGYWKETYYLNTDKMANCTEHDYVFQLLPDRQKTYLPCDGDPETHYLAGAYGQLVCAKCGDKTSPFYNEFMEVATPETEKHTFDAKGKCGICGYIKGKEALEITVTTDTDSGIIGDSIGASATAKGGDGKYSFAWTVTRDGIGIVNTDLSIGPRYNIVADVPGEYVFMATVRDGKGTLASAPGNPIVIVDHICDEHTVRKEIGTPIYINNGAGNHTKIVNVRTECEICGKVIKEKETVSTEEEHQFTDGVCFCGQNEHVHTYEEVELKRSNYEDLNTEWHNVTVTCVMRCTSCGDTLDEQTKVIREEHQYTIKEKPEETHYDGLGHKITERCVCGAAHDAGYGKKDKCCKCFDHEWGEVYEENGSWYQKCQVCGEIIDSGKPVNVLENDTNMEEEEMSSQNDELIFYRALTSCLYDDQIPMKNETIRSIVQNELMNRTNNDANLTRQIMKCVEQAPLLYQKLYLWSLFDYQTVEDSSITVSHYNKDDCTIYIKDLTTDAFFHETGHAIDHVLNMHYMSLNEYQSSLYNALYDKVYKIVATEVINASSDTELTTEQKNAIIEYIMEEEQDIKWQFKWYGLAFTTLKSEMDDSFSQEQKDVFKIVSESIQDNIIKKNPSEGSNGSQMLTDMIAGFTNQSVMGGYLPRVLKDYGHGPLTSMIPFFGDGYPADYWYTDDGNPTYMQNAEAWAEYFSSIMTGHNLHNNRELFKEACEIMDTMAIDLLEGYIAKHLNN